MWYVYILKCVDGTHYVGCTLNLKQRFVAHKKGNVKSTKHKLPIELIICAAFKDKYKAYYFEKYLKSGSVRAFLKRHFL